MVLMVLLIINIIDFTKNMRKIVVLLITIDTL